MNLNKLKTFLFFFAAFVFVIVPYVILVDEYMAVEKNLINKKVVAWLKKINSWANNFFRSKNKK